MASVEALLALRQTAANLLHFIEVHDAFETDLPAQVQLHLGRVDTGPLIDLLEALHQALVEKQAH